jgi:hypothetical protein
MLMKLRWVSVILILVGIAGFMTVADDLRHKGELLGVGSILCLGLVGLVASFFGRRGS